MKHEFTNNCDEIKISQLFGYCSSILKYFIQIFCLLYYIRPFRYSLLVEDLWINCLNIEIEWKRRNVLIAASDILLQNIDNISLEND